MTNFTPQTPQGADNTSAKALLQNREIEIAALMTLRIKETDFAYRFQNFLKTPYTWQGLDYVPLVFDLQSSGSGRGLISHNIPYLLTIPEQKRFSVKRQLDLYNGLRDSLLAIAFIFPDKLDESGYDVNAIRQQRFKIRSSYIRDSVGNFEIDSLTDANWSATGDLLDFPTFRRQKYGRRDGHWNVPK